MKEAVTSGLIAVLEQHKFIVLLKGMRDILSKLNLLNVSMQTQSLPFSTLKVLVNATRECLKREWIDLSAPSHPMLVSGACVTRSGPGVARTILLFHIISARPSKQPLRVRTFLKVYMELGS